MFVINQLSLLLLLIRMFYGIQQPVADKQPQRVPLSFKGYPLKTAYNYIKTNSDHELDSWINQCQLVLNADTGKINIVHIGDSHIQADYFSGRMRELMQQSFGNGGRGLVFPYRVAKTNTPDNYKLMYGGEWSNCKNVSYFKVCDLGLSGIAAISNDSSAYFVISPNTYDSSSYDFSKLILFSKNTPTSFGYSIKKDSLNEPEYEKQFIDSTVSVIRFKQAQHFLALALRKETPEQNEFYMMGACLLNDKAGVVYNMAGINGAEYFSYLRCNLFTEHLKQLNPHLVILSMGTNEAFNSFYNSIDFRQNVSLLIDKVRMANPEVSVLLTMPSESLMRRRLPARRLPEIRQILYEVAKEKNCAVWDMYEVMGAAGSMKRWFHKGLARKDMVHFKPRGYQLQGELLYSALMDYYTLKTSSR